MAVAKKKARTRKKDLSQSIAEAAIFGILEKKGNDIHSLDLRKVDNAVTDYFIICHGDSNVQVSAIAKSVEEEVRKLAGEKPWHKEGYDNSEWVLLDYVNVVIHIFQKDIREFYNLEDLWADAKIKKIASE